MTQKNYKNFLKLWSFILRILRMFLICQFTESQWNIKIQKQNWWIYRTNSKSHQNCFFFRLYCSNQFKECLLMIMDNFASQKLTKIKGKFKKTVMKTWKENLPSFHFLLTFFFISVAENTNQKQKKMNSKMVFFEILSVIILQIIWKKLFWEILQEWLWNTLGWKYWKITWRTEAKRGLFMKNLFLKVSIW